jgi:hypothetical protein
MKKNCPIYFLRGWDIITYSGKQLLVSQQGNIITIIGDYW